MRISSRVTNEANHLLVSPYSTQSWSRALTLSLTGSDRRMPVLSLNSIAPEIQAASRLSLLTK